MGWKIDQLDPYGSVNEIQADDDLFEISKNSGTPGFPVYLPGDSKKITRKELISLLGGIPYSGARYEVVKETGNAIQNGVNFLAAYTVAAGKASAGDRVVVWVWAGNIDMNNTTLTLSPNVTIAGIGGPKDTIFDSAIGLSSIFSVGNSDSDYALMNLTIKNTGNPSGFSIAHGGGVIDNGSWDNVILEAKTSIGQEYAGNYSRVIANVADVLNGSVSGLIENSTAFAVNCFSATTVDGIIKNCNALNLAGTNEGTIDNCIIESDDTFAFSTVLLADGATMKYTSVINNSSTDAIEVESGAEVKVLHCESNKDLNEISGATFTNLIYLPRNVIWGNKFEVFISPDVDPIDGFYHKFKKYIDSSGEWQTIDLGPV